MLSNFKAPRLNTVLPGLNPLKEADVALIENNEFLLEDEIYIDLKNIIGTGVDGLIFANDHWVVKLEHMPKLKKAELKLTQWASEKKVGPKLYSWGTAYVSEVQLLKFAQITKNSGFIQPKWLQRWLAKVPFKPIEDMVFTVTERWNSSLQEYVRANGGGVDAFAKVPVEVMAKFVEKLKMLHDLGVVHADLQAKNVLVRLSEFGEIVDLAIIDFGLAFPRSAWYFEMDQRNRSILLEFYLNEPWVQSLMPRFPAAVNESPYAAGHRWLLYEPFNFDWLLPRMYETLVMKCHDTLPEVIYFNFNLKWDKHGRLVIELIVGEEKRLATVHGFETLKQLREDMGARVDMSKHEFQYEQTYIVSRKIESQIYVSQMITSGNQIVMVAE